MISNSAIIEKEIQELPYNQLIIASEFYQEVCPQITESAFAKSLERLSKNNELVHLTKGVYYRPRKSRFGIVPISDEEITKHYLQDQQGVLVGYKLYNQKGITTQIGKKVEILSTNLKEDQKHIRNVSIRKININLNNKTISAIEAMEILQGYRSIEDLNTSAFVKIISDFAHEYSDSAMDEVLKHIKYKKSTIAFMAAFLNYLNVENTLQKYLSPMSNYNIPKMEGLYEFAQ